MLRDQRLELHERSPERSSRAGGVLQVQWAALGVGERRREQLARAFDPVADLQAEFTRLADTFKGNPATANANGNDARPAQASVQHRSPIGDTFVGTGP